MKRIRTILIAAIGMMASAVQAQEITAKNEVIDCGSVLWEHPVTVKFELHNSGYQPLVISRVHPGCDCTTADFPKGAIAPGEAFTIEATYDARQMGHFLKDIAVYSNASEKPFYLSIRGVVAEEVVDYSGTYPFTLADAKADMVDVEFDDVNRGDMPLQRIHIMNAGSQAISPTVMHLPDYLKATVSPTTIAPNRQGTVTLTLDSKRLRDYGLTQTSVFLGMFPGDKVAPEKEISVSAVLLPAFTEMTETELANAPQMRLSQENIKLNSNKAKPSRPLAASSWQAVYIAIICPLASQLPRPVTTSSFTCGAMYGGTVSIWVQKTTLGVPHLRKRFRVPSPTSISSFVGASRWSFSHSAISRSLPEVESMLSMSLNNCQFIVSIQS